MLPGMSDDEGLRARKKRRTRRALADAALRLFAEQGYDTTTVAQIAEAADVSTKTFFNYFPAKEDVLFSDANHRLATAIEAIEERSTDETLEQTISRVVRRLIDLVASPDADIAPEHVALRTRLILTVPTLQGATLRAFQGAQRRIAEELRRAYPHQLDDVAAAALVGTLVGAIQAGVIASLERGDTTDAVLAALHRSADIAMVGIRATAQSDLGGSG